jgi:hypothetical protein
VLDVDLVHDAGAGRYDAELVERGLTPAQELVALPVAAVLELHVALERVGPAEHVGDHRVVDDQLRRRERVDLRRVAAEVPDRLAHGRQVDDARYPREVLHQHPRRGELDLHARLRRRVPVTQRADVRRGDVRPVLRPQQVLQQDLQAVRQPLLTADPVEPVNVVCRIADAQRALRTEGVEAGHVNSFTRTSLGAVSRNTPDMLR